MTILYFTLANHQILYLRHKLYKSCGDPPIFPRFLFLGIGRSSPDFFDLEPCRKSHAPDVWRPPPGNCSATARFTLQMTKISGDGPTTISRGPGGDCRGTCRWPSDAKKSYDHPTIIGRSPFGHRAAIDGFDRDVMLAWTFNVCMLIVIINNFYCS